MSKFIKYMLKHAEPEVFRNLSINQYRPLGSYRELDPEEEDLIAIKTDRLIPKIWRSKSTPLSDTLASPSKLGLATMGGFAALGSLLGSGLGSMDERVGAGRGAVSGLLAGGTIGVVPALIAYFRRKRNNENTIDYMKRLPKGATIRDMEADPVYQREMDRLNAIRAAQLAGTKPIS